MSERESAERLRQEVLMQAQRIMEEEQRKLREQIEQERKEQLEEMQRLRLRMQEEQQAQVGFGRVLLFLFLSRPFWATCWAKLRKF